MEKTAWYGYLLFTTQKHFPFFTVRDFTYFELFELPGVTDAAGDNGGVCRRFHAGRGRRRGPGPQLRVKRMGFEMAADGTDSGQFSKKHRGLGC